MRGKSFSTHSCMASTCGFSFWGATYLTHCLFPVSWVSRASPLHVHLQVILCSSSSFIIIYLQIPICEKYSMLHPRCKYLAKKCHLLVTLYPHRQTQNPPGTQSFYFFCNYLDYNQDPWPLQQYSKYTLSANLWGKCLLPLQGRQILDSEQFCLLWWWWGRAWLWWKSNIISVRMECRWWLK